MRIRKYTSRALLLSLCVHVIFMFVVSVFLINRFDAEKESISAEIFEEGPEMQVRRRVLPQRTRLDPRMAKAKVSDVSPALLTYTPQLSVPKALVHADVVPDVVTYTDMAQIDEPSPVSNISISKDKTVKTLKSVDPKLEIFDIAVMPGHGLVGEVFVPGSAITRMPNFDRMLPVYTFVASTLNVRTRNYTKGFPTPDEQSVIENFAIRFRAELRIETPGLYTFWLKSDDGSQLYINGKLVVDNDGIHSAISRQGHIKLGPGTYPVEIRYFQGPRYAIALQWFYRPPNSSVKIVPPEVIYLPSEP